MAAAEEEIRRLRDIAKNPRHRGFDFDTALAIGLRDEQIRDLEAGRFGAHPASCTAGARVEPLERDLASMRVSRAEQDRAVSSLRASLERAAEVEQSLRDEASQLRSDLDAANADLRKAVTKLRVGERPSTRGSAPSHARL